MREFLQTPADLIEQIIQTARAAVPDSLSKDVRDNVRSALQEVISELDVVTREELDIQTSVLNKTRAKVDEMELIIADLEQRLDLHD